jgi:pSer/pThr/pTyr-binding forkhead associated (FHA) protein
MLPSGTSIAMKPCSNCGHINRVGLLFCDECGWNLASATNVTLPTRKIQNETNDASAKATWGSARFGEGSQVILHIRDASTPLKLPAAPHLTIGRSDVGSAEKPNIDFAPYGALDKGVSRSHAMIELSEDTLTLIDTGSANGTFLNGQRLVPNQPRVLRDGDEIRLGKLIAHIYFERNS